MKSNRTTPSAIKEPCRAGTTASITLSGLQTVDSVVLAANNRVLVKNQASVPSNGIYLVQSGAWLRSPDADRSASMTPGFTVVVTEGGQADTTWILATNAPIVLGTTALTFSQATGATIPDSSIVGPIVTGEAVAAGQVVTVLNDTGTAKIYLSDADGAALRADAIGLVVVAAGSGVSTTIRVGGEMSTADGVWDVVPATADVGKRAYLSTTPGIMSLTSPTASGTVSLRIGWVSRGGSGTTKLVVSVGEGRIN